MYIGLRRRFRQCLQYISVSVHISTVASCKYFFLQNNNLCCKMNQKFLTNVGKILSLADRLTIKIRFTHLFWVVVQWSSRVSLEDRLESTQMNKGHKEGRNHFLFQATFGGSPKNLQFPQTAAKLCEIVNLRTFSKLRVIYTVGAFSHYRLVTWFYHRNVLLTDRTLFVVKQSIMWRRALPQTPWPHWGVCF